MTLFGLVLRIDRELAGACKIRAMDSEALVKLVTMKMPFGKHAGRALADLPGNYLAWFAREGFPPGELGRLLQLMQEIDHNGLSQLLDPLRNKSSK